MTPATMPKRPWNDHQIYALLAGALLFWAALLWATSTIYTQPFSAGHGWTYTQVSCGGTCSQDMAHAADGNPAPSILAKLVGKNKTSVGYASKSYAWTALGVPAGENVSTVDGAWDAKQTHTTGNCSTSATMGMQLYDSGNTVQITTSAVEPNLDVSGNTSWTTRDGAGAIAVTGTYAPAATTITLRLNMNPATTNVTNADCETLGDNYKLTIVSAAGSVIRKKLILVWVPVQDRPQPLGASAVKVIIQ